MFYQLSLTKKEKKMVVFINTLGGLWGVQWEALGFPSGSVVKNPPANAGDVGLISGSGRFLWRRKWQPTPVFLSGKSHGQRSLAGYSPWGHKELDMTEWLTLSLSRWFWTKLSIKIWEGLFKAFFFLCSLSLFVPLWLNLWLNLFSGLDWWSGSSPSKNSQRFCIC